MAKKYTVLFNPVILNVSAAIDHRHPLTVDVCRLGKVRIFSVLCPLLATVVSYYCSEMFLSSIVYAVVTQFLGCCHHHVEQTLTTSATRPSGAKPLRQGTADVAGVAAGIKAKTV